MAGKFAYPERVAVAFVGDGAMQMSGNGELITAAKYWREWIDPRLVVVVLNNRELSFVSWEMRVKEGDPKFEASQDLPHFSYARYAESLGLKGIVVDRPELIGEAIEAAFAADRPVVLDVHTDPNIPPLPPRVTAEQAISFAESMIKSDPETPKPFFHSLGQVLRGLFPR